MKFPLYGKIKHVPNHQPARNGPIFVGAIFLDETCTLITNPWWIFHDFSTRVATLYNWKILEDCMIFFLVINILKKYPKYEQKNIREI